MTVQVRNFAAVRWGLVAVVLVAALFAGRSLPARADPDGNCPPDAWQPYQCYPPTPSASGINDGSVFVAVSLGWPGSLPDSGYLTRSGQNGQHLQDYTNDSGFSDTYVDSQVTAGQSYTYTVCAVYNLYDGDGNSLGTDPECANANATVPSTPASGSSSGGSSSGGGGSRGGAGNCGNPNQGCPVDAVVTNVQLVAGIGQNTGTATLTYQTPAMQSGGVEVVELEPTVHNFPPQSLTENQSESQTIDNLAPSTKVGFEICTTIVPLNEVGPVPSGWTCVGSPIVTTEPPPPQVNNVIIKSNPDHAEIAVAWQIVNPHPDQAYYLDVARYIVPQSLIGSANACQVNTCTSDKDWYSGPCNGCTTASISTSATDLDDPSVAAGTYYQYQVCYYTACAWSQSVETWKAPDYNPILTNAPIAGHLLQALLPTAPSNVKVTSGDSRYEVTWSDTDTSITSYDVQTLRGPALTGHWVVVGSTTKQELSVQLPDGFVSVGSETFQVCAVNQYGRTCSDSVHP